MGHSVTIGGEKIGAGKKMKAYLHGYERSTHDLGYVWKSTMSPGTLVPFMVKLALPGDTFDIDLTNHTLTLPTNGPLFGHYQMQMDVFQCPIRLYQGKVNMNRLNIGRDMSKVPLPQLELVAEGRVSGEREYDTQQINPSSIFHYLGIKGLGHHPDNTSGPISRRFNGVPYVAYWDIYKNYYANKQEGIGAVIHKTLSIDPPDITGAFINNRDGNQDISTNATPLPELLVTIWPETTIQINVANLDNDTTASQFMLTVQYPGTSGTNTYPINTLFHNVYLDVDGGIVWASAPVDYIPGSPNNWKNRPMDLVIMTAIPSTEEPADTEPQIVTFPLTNLDGMRDNLQTWLDEEPYVISEATLDPYGLPFTMLDGTPPVLDNYSKLYNQEGLALKTYDSDLFNNWIDTEWIDGTTGVNEVTKISTVSGGFTIDELNLKSKIYKMLNRIAISDGTYDSWQDANWDHERIKSATNPMYIGGLIKTIVFEEVVSNAASADQPLGTLAGKGRNGSKHKGGHIVAKIDEPSYIIGIASITPVLDYSQGNDWHTRLRTYADFHVPALDEIGFEDLITDQMAWWDTTVTPGGIGEDSTLTFKSAGKQPAWINYMTDVNQVHGNFADPSQQMYMVLNRKYSVGYTLDGEPTIADLTTYIDPTKFNNIFADTRRDAQNFWVQIGCGITARRKMSAKIMPNL